MAETLSPVPRLSFLDNNGKPLVGGKLFTYEAGTSTKLATYSNAGGTPNANPVILDYRGEASVWIPPNVPYKYVLAPSNDTDPPGNPVWTQDNVVNSQLVTLYGGVDTGSVNAYVLNFVANFTSYTDGIIIYWLPSSTNTGPSTINVNGLGPVAITQQDGTAVTAGMIQANVFCQIIYKGTGFSLLTITAQSGSFTGTVSGYGSAPPDATVYYQRTQDRVSLWITQAARGLSNSTSMTLSGIPSSLRPTNGVSLYLPPMVVENNSADALSGGIVSYTGVITFKAWNGTTFSATGFTNGGGTTKGLPTGWSTTYPLA